MSSKITMVVVSSINGYITNKDDPDIYKWTSPEDSQNFFDMFKKSDLVIMGSQTYTAIKSKINLTLGTTAGTALEGNTPLLPEAPSDGKTYGRKDTAWAEIVAGDVTQTGTQMLTNKTIHGNANTITVDGVNEVGFRNIPQNSKSTAYTCVLDDAGKHILHPAGDTTARTYTIPANASVPYPIGTAITFVNQNGTGGVVTIAITSDTMRLAGAGTTGSRTLARNGIATALKIASTEWIISGGGLT